MKITEDMYTKLFNSITDAVETLEEVRENLKKAQIDAEEIYISEKEKIEG